MLYTFIKKKILRKLPFVALAYLIIFSFAYSEDLTSTNFIIRDPVMGTGGNYGSSASFQLYSSGNTLLSGTGSSATYIGRYGFLYYPFVDIGTLTATANGMDADLSWPASASGQGWTVDGYNTGISTTPGGPYTYTDVGNVTSYTYQDLAPDDYCFVVQTYDALGYVIGTSNEDCITIEPTLVFDIDTPASGSGESSAPYAVSLGAITTTDTRVSGATDGVQIIVLEADTNAQNGIVVTVRNQNGSNGLVSLSVPASNINSADGTMADGTENYGLCVATAGLTGFSRASPYDSGACAVDSETNAVQGLTTSGESMVSASGTISGAHAEVIVNGAISVTTPAQNDYSDALTFIATSTF